MQIDWDNAPEGAQWFAPKDVHLQGWYKLDTDGYWLFADMSGEWSDFVAGNPLEYRKTMIPRDLEGKLKFFSLSFGSNSVEELVLLRNLYHAGKLILD